MSGLTPRQTDIEVFAEMLNRAGVVGRREDGRNGQPLIEIYAQDEDGDEEKQLGYRGFRAEFEFSKDDGALLSVGVWE